MRFLVFKILAVLLMAVSIFFFLKSVHFAADRRYTTAILCLVIGGFVISAGRDMARLAFLQKQ